MIESAPFLNDFYSQMLSRTDRFLATRGARLSDYAIVWQADPGSRMVVIRYDEARFDDGDYRARISFSGPEGSSVIDTGLRMALGILRSTFDHADNVAALRTITSSNHASKAIGSAGLAHDPYASGLFIDRDSNPYRLENVEANGHRTTLATATSIAALDYVLAMIAYQARARVGQRFAEFD